MRSCWDVMDIVYTRNLCVIDIVCTHAQMPPVISIFTCMCASAPAPASVSVSTPASACVSAPASASTSACVCAQELEDAATANSSALSSASAVLLETARREAAQNRISADELSVQLEVCRLIIDSCHTSEGLFCLVTRMIHLRRTYA